MPDACMLKRDEFKRAIHARELLAMLSNSVFGLETHLAVPVIITINR
jgi:hypothetical protein